MAGKFIYHFLKLLRLDELDLKYYLGNFLYLSGAQAISLLLGFGLSVAFARLATRELYGQWSYVLSIAGVAAILSLPGMNTAIAQATARGHHGALLAGTRQRFKWSVLGIIVLAGVGGYYLISGPVLTGQAFMVTAVFFAFFHNFETYEAFLSGQKSFRKLARYRAIAQVAAISLTVAAIYFSGNLALILAVYLFSFSVLRGVFLRNILRQAENQSAEPETVSYGKRLTLTQVPGLIRQHYDKLIIGVLLTFPDLAIYSIALAFSELFIPFRAILASLIFPKLSVMDRTTAYAEVKKRLVPLLLGSAVLFGVLIIVCPYLIPLVYSQDYVASVFYAQILLASMIFATPVPVLNKALFPAQRELKSLSRLNTANALLEIGLLTFMVLKFGLLGAAVTKLVTRFLTLAYGWWLAR